jgi:hypothetical protein
MYMLRWLLLPALILASCSEDPEPSVPQAAGPLFPLTIGSTWDHLYTSYDETGKIVDAYHDFTKVESQSEIDGVKWSVISSSTSTELTSWALKSDGVWIKPEGVTPFLLFMYPAKVNDTYETNEMKIRVSGSDFTQDFPVGLLSHCYQYEVRFVNEGGRWYKILFTLAPNIGLVEIEYFKGPSQPHGLKAILSTYTIK